MSSPERTRDLPPPTQPRRTLPPPELFDRPAPDSVSSLLIENFRAEAPVSRHSGPRGDEVFLRGQITAHRATGDVAAERRASVALAGLLARRGRDLALAVKLARRALSIEDNAALRTELAGWLAGLGDAALAAATLRGLCDSIRPVEMARILVKIGVLLARGDDPSGAADALREAALMDPQSALPYEVLGALTTWAPATLPPEEAAAAYLEAASRREAVKEKEAAFEDRLRAFDAAPGDEAAMTSLSEALEAAGRLAAACEVRRSHAALLSATYPGDPEILEYTVEVHRKRLLAAWESGDVARAVGAIFDGGFEAEREGELGALVTETSERAGLAKLIAAKLESGGFPSAEHPRDRAEALVDLADMAPPAIRAVLLAAASDLYAAANMADVAADAAGLASDADRSSARAAATLLARVGGHADTALIERAIGLVVPRAALCDALAEGLEANGELELAFAWTQHWLALQPGCLDAMNELLRRATSSANEARIVGALDWVLAQPSLISSLASPIADALDVLESRGSANAGALARRCLDIVGPRVAEFSERLLALADRLDDAALGIAVLERRAAIEPPEGALGDLLLALVERRWAAGDLDGAACELAQAAACGAASRSVLERAEGLDVAAREQDSRLSSDGVVALGEARALALGVLAEQGGDALASPERAARAFRELGSLRWDLGQDRRGADAALFRACELIKEGGVERYARDLESLAGPDVAIEMLMGRAAQIEGENYRLRAHLLFEAATLANARGLRELALRAATRTIEEDPSRTDAVALIEKNAQGEEGIELLDRTYDLLARAALGCYGRRAAHYRGARQLERRGAVELALRHACASFEAVPSEGATYMLLARLSERVGDPNEAVRALERVASNGDLRWRIGWLKRAASLTVATEDGARMRLNLLLRALNVLPEPATVDEIENAIRDIIALSGESEVMELRFERAVSATLPKLDGPDGARTAVAMTRVAARLGILAAAFAALERAMEADGDIDEFATLSELVPDLSREPTLGAAWIAKVCAAAERPYSSVGTALLRLAGSLARAIRETGAAAALLVQAARRTPEDDQLVNEADAAVASLDAPELRVALDDALPASRRVEALSRLADEHERAGQVELAIPVLERIVATGKLDPEAQERTTARLRDLLFQVGREDDAENLLWMELVKPGIPDEARARMARDLANLLARRGEWRQAIDVLMTAAQGSSKADELITEIRDLSRSLGDVERHARVLARVLEVAPDDAARLSVLRELAPLSLQLGDHDAALAHYETIAELDPSDAEVFEVLEREANERGDHEAIAELLARRIAEAEPERRRMLRLRRAAALEQRLGKLDEASAELQLLLEENPDDISALRFLADIHERRGAPLEAAALLHRLGELATTSDEQAEYGLRATASYLAGNDINAAETTLESIAPIAPRDAVVDLRVQLARRRGDGRALSDALDLLASSSREPPERRAAILVEASRAAAAIGDDTAALDRARRAARLAPNSPAAILEARRLEYRLGGAGAPREAQIAVDELIRIADHLEPEQVELHAFLLAEELDVIQGGSAGMRELSRRHAEVGPLPLVALGMAERLVRSKNFDAALPLFEQALTGDLRGLRSRGRLALAAAEAAVNAHELDAAAQLLAIADAEPETHVPAQRKLLELTALRGDPEAAQRALEELARISTGLDRGRVLAQLGRLLSTTKPTMAARVLEEASTLAGGDRTLNAQIAETLAQISLPEPEAPVPEPPEPPAPVAAPLPEPAPPPSPAAVEPPTRPSQRPPVPSAIDAVLAPSSLSPASLQSPALIAEPMSKRHIEPMLRGESTLRKTHGSSEEFALLRELMNGSFEAGEKLVELYGERSAERMHDVLAVRKQQAAIRLGDPVALRKLHDAAVLDGNASYARAVEHVIALVDPNVNAPEPPPLAVQRHEPDLVTGLLFRQISESPIHEALAIVLETGLYRRDVAQYQLTGVARVQPGTATPLAEAYGTISRMLGLGRIPLFHQRSSTPATVRIALLSPPAIVLTGDVREETSELRYQLGASLTASLPEHALVNTLPEESLRTLIDALHAAFGPVANLPRGDAAVARLGQNLWQLVSPWADRRLRELCQNQAAISYEAAVNGTRQAMRRAGLFAAGSLATALALTAFELAVPSEELFLPFEGLAHGCARYPAIADLVCLAIRTEFAEARWVSPTPLDRYRSESGTRSRAGG